MFKGPSASSTPTTISSTTSNRSLNRVHCSFSFDEKKKKKTKSFDLHSYRRTYSFNRRIRAFARACIIQCNLLILTYLLYHLSPRYFRLYVTYIHTYTYTYTYIYTYTRTTYVHTHAFVHTNRHIKRPFSRCTRDIKSSNKKKKHERKAKKRKRRKKRKGKGKRTRGAFSLVTFASARYFTSIFHRFID